MREIIFRGKVDNLSSDTGKWIQGPYVPESSGGYIYNTMYRPHMVRVDPATVGQYTGLTDKHGKRIFEGDIIKGRRTKAYAVEYSRNIAGFIARGIGILSVPCMNPGTMKDYEIIGNIHDHPDLMTEEERR